MKEGYVQAPMPRCVITLVPRWSFLDTSPMSWAYLIVSVAALCFTLNALRPIRRPGSVALASFFAGWLTDELALHHLCIQIALAIVFASLGALSDWPGWIGLATAHFSWVGLLISHKKSRHARRVLETALHEGLHGGNGSGEPPVPLKISPKLEWGRLARVFPIRRPNVERVRNIPYADSAGRRLKLDVYRHRDRPSNRPALLFIHGGGWVIGSKGQQGLCTVNHFAERGWVCFNANYRLSPRATFPDHLIDVKRAIRWVREHGEEYGADPDFLVLAGGSAGGHLTSLATLTANDPQYQPGFEDVDTSVSACVPLYGVYDFSNSFGHWPYRSFHRLLARLIVKKSRRKHPEVYEALSPILQVDGTAPPFCLIHGENDSLVPPAEAREFARALREHEAAPVVHAELPGAQHAFEIFPSVRQSYVMRAMERFCAFVYAASQIEKPEGIEPSVVSEVPTADSRQPAAISL